jgi:peptide/nickel transport system permease protein
MSVKIEPSVDEVSLREGFTDASESLSSIYIRRFKKHTLGKIGLFILLFLYAIAIFSDFIAPYSMAWMDKRKSFHPPSKIHFLYTDNGKTRFRPYSEELLIKNVAFKTYAAVPAHTIRALAYDDRTDSNELRVVATDDDAELRSMKILSDLRDRYDLEADEQILSVISSALAELEADPDPDARRSLRFDSFFGDISLTLVKGSKNFLTFFPKSVQYSFLGFMKMKVHLIGSSTGGFFLMGTDQLGKDVFSRLVHGSRISLSIGIIGVLISFSIGLLMGGIAGYFGGWVDILIMRLCEIIMSFPGIYLLFALRATFPPSLNSIQVYLLIVVILAFISWASLARVIRGMVLSIKNEEYVLAAKAMGLGKIKIIVKHILVNTLSYVIIQATVSIPRYILGESALSLLGLGITEPQSSWGLMLSVAQNTRVIKDFPWILIPGFMIFISIMAWNFVGDGVRDAVDPKTKG